MFCNLVVCYPAHPLGAFETGPHLLVCPGHTTASDAASLGRDVAESCDAWFLWKPEAMTTLAHSCAREVVSEKEVEELCRKASLCRDGELILSLATELLTDLHMKLLCVCGIQVLYL